MEAAAAHDFWFGGPLDDYEFLRSRIDVWFNTDASFDAEVRTRFGATLAAASAGRLDAWRDTPRGLLMLVIVLDQMPRNIHRGRPEAFASDAHARRLADAAFNLGFDERLSLIERVFLYMPFEHAEDLAAQDFCVAGYERLHAMAPPELQPLTREWIKAGRDHRDVIRRFGRFPHRNPIL
ncbi:MAG: DUF924 family protein, partial [Gammaproteobacteria bacterium]